MAYDFITRRVVHPAYILGLIGLFTLRQRGYLVETDAWLDLSSWFANLCKLNDRGVGGKAGITGLELPVGKLRCVMLIDFRPDIDLAA